MDQKPEINGESPDFLQSDGWLRFQESAGHQVVRITDSGFFVGGIIHSLPFVGRYLYTPRFPQTGNREQGTGNKEIRKLIGEARSHECGWVRMEPETEVVSDGIFRFAQNDKIKTVKAPHDMQPREVFVVDISKNEEELLAEMKPKVRYNVRLAEKKGVRVFPSDDEKFRKAFVNLVTGTADRKGIMPHPRRYYETMLETLLGDTATLFVAEHEGDILGVNLMIFHGDTATYLHGGSADVKREYMAPYLLQWEAMREAKRRGCAKYDFGGIHSQFAIRNSSFDSWAGITRFKTGFSPSTPSTVRPGCYDIVLSPSRYFLYRFFSALRAYATRIRKLLGI